LPNGVSRGLDLSYSANIAAVEHRTSVPR